MFTSVYSPIILSFLLGQPMTSPAKTFEIYRYQLLPITDKIQLSLGIPEETSINSIEELTAKKNSILQGTITSPKFHVYSRHSHVNMRVEGENEAVIIFRMAAKRSARIFSEDFKKKDIPNWPNCWIIMNNDPLVQKIAIEKNPYAFYSTHAVAEILLESINKRLQRYQLNIYIDRLKQNAEFWDTIKKYRDRITWLRFELISPNMSNLDGKLSINLRELLIKMKIDSNSHRTSLEFNSPNKGTLRIEKSNDLIKSAVEYMGEGLGESQIRIKNLKKKIQTTESTREIEIEEVILDGNAQFIADEFRKLLQ